MGPYGIQQIDIPGIVNNWRQANADRTRQMLANRQIELQEREADRQNSIRSVIARHMGGGGSEGGSSSGSPSAQPGNAELPGGAYNGGFAGITDLERPTDTIAPPQRHRIGGDRQAMFNELLAIDPETAFNTMRAFEQMDDQAFTRMQRANGVLAREAYRLQSMPPEERRAALRMAVPQLLQMGLTQEQVDGFDPTDDNLAVIINQATDIDDLAARARPDLMNVEGDVIDRNRIGTDQDPVVYRSEIINVDGVPYRRSDVLGQRGGGDSSRRPPSAAIDYLRANPGTAAQFDQMYGQGSAARILQGGAGGQRPQTFP